MHTGSIFVRHLTFLDEKVAETFSSGSTALDRIRSSFSNISAVQAFKRIVYYYKIRTVSRF